jgi:Xaa-Pro aminopeptidase
MMTRTFNRLPRLLCVVLQLGMVLLAALPAAAWEREPRNAFHERRARLVKETGGDGVVVLFGYREQDIGVSTTPFRQNENFYYLTGWTEPDAMLLLVPKAAQGANQAVELDKEILFIPPHDFRQENWTGPKLGPDDADAVERTGFPAVKSTTLFASELQEALKTFNKIYTEQTPQPESGEECFVPEMLSRLKKLAPLASFGDFRSILTRLRMVKSPGEIALIRKATEASMEAHLAALTAVRVGAWEYEVAARMKYEFERLGCEWPGYPPIVGSGFYATVLHYDQNSKQLADGDLVVMDVAGAYGGYASDITRTLPASGRFTPRQRELYEIVLAAEKAALAAVKPGMMLGRGGTPGLHQIAYEYINTHGKDLHGQPLGQYFIHGLSHSVGLNVHDPFDYNQPLQAGMVVTIEPGVYIPEEKIGVRIEDLVLVTKDGSELLTRRLPRTVEEIERLMPQK